MDCGAVVCDAMESERGEEMALLDQQLNWCDSTSVPCVQARFAKISSLSGSDVGAASLIERG